MLALSMLAFSGMNAMQLTHKGNDFFVEKENQIFPIQRAFIDKELRGISGEQLSKLATAGAYLKLNKMNDSDDFTLRLGGRLEGSGIFGANAGFYTGKFLTHLVAQAAIGIVGVGVSLVATPAAGWVVVAALEKTTLVPIEYASNVVGVGMGVLGAVASGPV